MSTLQDRDRIRARTATALALTTLIAIGLALLILTPTDHRKNATTTARIAQPPSQAAALTAQAPGPAGCVRDPATHALICSHAAPTPTATPAPAGYFRDPATHKLLRPAIGALAAPNAQASGLLSGWHAPGGPGGSGPTLNAAAQQSASTVPSNGFDYADAAIGAGVAGGVALLITGGTLGVRRRSQLRP